MVQPPYGQYQAPPYQAPPYQAPPYQPPQAPRGGGMQPPQGPGMAPPKGSPLRFVGAGIWVLGVLVGLLLLGYFFALPPEVKGRYVIPPDKYYTGMLIGALIAFPACFVYLWVPVIVDRYDPEPWWLLAMSFLWGAIPACAFSALFNDINSAIGGAIAGKAGADIAGAVISAPLVEEAFKGMLVLGVFLFARHQFDGVVDGVIYATFVALGFAATENVLYYSRAWYKGGGEALCCTVSLRGLIAPWGHPLYTAMTGLGVGWARESNSMAVKIFAPIGGYFAAAFLHSCWNGSAVFSDLLGVPLFPIALLFFLLFLVAFGVIVILLVRREGKIIRHNLQDELLLGNITKEELELVCSPFGRMKALMGAGGSSGRKFVDAASRLALSKWHTSRAMQGRKQTISADFIVPMRQEMARLRQEIQGRR